MVNIRGYEFKQITIRNSYNRRALQYKNKIINHLKVFGLNEDNVDIPMETVTMRKAQASVSWFMWNEHLFFSYNGSAKFVENLAMVEQVIEHFIHLLEGEDMTPEQFLEIFVEDVDIIDQRKDARKVMGVEEDSIDFEVIHKNYKKLSKEHHPDMPNGNTETFKRINNAHKLLKKELC
ncbi:MAG: J domain-containing protein [Nanoarchaeota archaeon]